MMRLTGPCTIKVAVDCLLQIDPKSDETGYNIQLIREDTGEIMFAGYFGLNELPLTGEGSIIY